MYESSLENAVSVLVEMWWTMIVWSLVSLGVIGYIDILAGKVKRIELSVIDLLGVITLYLISSVWYSIVIAENGFPLLSSLGVLIIWAGWGAPQGWNKIKSANDSQLG